MKSKGFLQRIFDINARANWIVGFPSEWSVMMIPPPVGIIASLALAVPTIPFVAIGAATRAVAKAAHKPLNTDSWFND